MSNRLDQEREKRLQPKRIQFALNELIKLNINVVEFDKTKIKFEFKNETIIYYPYSGWHSGKSIVDGRGWKKLKKQIENAD